MRGECLPSFTIDVSFDSRCAVACAPLFEISQSNRGADTSCCDHDSASFAFPKRAINARQPGPLQIKLHTTVEEKLISQGETNFPGHAR
jgi:hypothetical protein